MTDGERAIERALGAAEVQAAANAAAEARPALSYDDYMAYDTNRGGDLRNLMSYGLPEAYQRSGIYYSPRGARAGYEDYGFPAPVFQSSPYATAIGRTFAVPGGGLGWQPLQGFPSAYPHVINGVPSDFWSIIAPYMPPLWQQPTWQPPAPVARQAAAPARAAAPVAQQKKSAPAKPAETPPPQPDPKYMIPPELRYQGGFVGPVQAPDKQGIDIPKAPAHFWQYGAAGYGNFTPPAIPDFTPDLVDPAIAAEDAGIELPAPNLVTPEETATPRPAAPYPYVNAPGLEPRIGSNLERMLFPNGLPQVSMPQPRPPLQVPPAIATPQAVEPTQLPPTVVAPQVPVPQVPVPRTLNGALPTFAQTNPEYFIRP